MPTDPARYIARLAVEMWEAGQEVRRAREAIQAQPSPVDADDKLVYAWDRASNAFESRRRGLLAAIDALPTDVRAELRRCGAPSPSGLACDLAAGHAGPHQCGGASVNVVWD